MNIVLFPISLSPESNSPSVFFRNKSLWVNKIRILVVASDLIIGNVVIRSLSPLLNKFLIKNLVVELFWISITVVR